MTACSFACPEADISPACDAVATTGYSVHGDSSKGGASGLAVAKLECRFRFEGFLDSGSVVGSPAVRSSGPHILNPDNDTMSEFITSVCGCDHSVVEPS